MMSDLIERSVLVEILKDALEEGYVDSFTDNVRKNIFDEVFEIVEDKEMIPTIEAPQWIPFSERQPDIPHVLITVKWSEDDYEVLEEDWWCGEYEIEHGTAKPIVKEMHEKAVAWMPMPKEYRSE